MEVVKYTNLEKKLKITAMSRSGNMVFLEDGSKWTIYPEKAADTQMWREGDLVHIYDPGHERRIPDRDYLMKNIDKGEVARCFLFKKD